jgi:hypothetical protein
LVRSRFDTPPTKALPKITIKSLLSSFYLSFNPYKPYANADKQIISENDMRIKLNFANFVRRFEREYLNVLEFGYNMPFNSKINFITSKFNDYASESKRGQN